VSYGGQQVWDWSADKSFSAQSNALSLQPGDCWDWTTRWEPPAGSPKGTYTLEGRSYAKELDSAKRSWTATFTL
jgi:hypothetical protein